MTIPLSKGMYESFKLISEKCKNVILSLKDEQNDHRIPFSEKQLASFYDKGRSAFITVLSESLKKGGEFILFNEKVEGGLVVENHDGKIINIKIGGKASGLN